MASRSAISFSGGTSLKGWARSKNHFINPLSIMDQRIRGRGSFVICRWSVDDCCSRARTAESESRIKSRSRNGDGEGDAEAGLGEEGITSNNSKAGLV